MKFDSLFQNETDTVSAQPGEKILTAGTTSKHCFVILEGAVEIQYEGSLLASEGPGGLVGELALVDDGAVSADVIATEETRLAVIDERRFQFLVQQHPFFALNVMKVMSERLRRMNQLN
ncbi:MAG: cyclic nucleotide-binding domain-containing protein [Verrucomicrobiota bacterium]